MYSLFQIVAAALVSILVFLAKCNAIKHLQIFSRLLGHRLWMGCVREQNIQSGHGPKDFLKCSERVSSREASIGEITYIQVFFTSVTSDSVTWAWTSRGLSPHEGHLAIVDDPRIQNFLHCFIKYRKSLNKLPSDSVMMGERVKYHEMSHRLWNWIS